MIDLKGYRNFLHERELSQSTVSLYMGTLGNFQNFYDEVTKANLLDFKSKLTEKYSPSTVNVRLSALRMYCAFAGLPFTVRQIRIHKPSHIENVITEEQYNHLIASLERDGQVRWIFNIKMISMTGARISEALKITKADVLKGYATMFTKGKIRTVQIPKSLQEQISDYIKPLKNNDVIIQMSRQNFSKTLKSFSKYDIPEEVLHPHSFRHFFAVEFCRRNSNISLLADILGHSNTTVTMIYLRMSQEQQKRIIDSTVNW